MDITPLIAADRQVIQSYSPGRFKISGSVYTGPVIVLPGHTALWALSGPTATADDFLILLPESPDVVLFGCGAHFTSPMIELRQALKARGLVLEVMDTGAACRTYNVLLSEGRRVAAVLLPV